MVLNNPVQYGKVKDSDMVYRPEPIEQPKTNWALKALPEVLKALPNVISDMDDLKVVSVKVETFETDMRQIHVCIGTPATTYSLLMEAEHIFNTATAKDCDVAVEFEWIMVSALRDLINKAKAAMSIQDVLPT